MQISLISLIHMPTDCLLIVLNKIDSNTLVRTSTVCKHWFAILELEWERRSQQLLRLSLKTSSTWREHYFSVLCPRQLERMRMSRPECLCTTSGASMLFIDMNLEVSSFKTDHTREITIINSTGDYLLTSSLDKTIKVWKYQSSKNIMLRSTCEGLDSYVSALLPINENFVSGGYNGNLNYWVEQKGKYQIHRTLEKVHKATIVCLSYCKHKERQRYIVSGALDGTIGLSKLTKGNFKHLLTRRGHKDAISGMGMISYGDEPYIATGGATYSAICFWRLQTNTEKLVIDKIAGDAHPGGVTDIKTDGPYFFTCGKDRSVKKWYIQKEVYKITTDYIPASFGKLKLLIPYFGNPDWSCIYLAEGNKIVASNQDGSIWKDINELNTQKNLT